MPSKEKKHVLLRQWELLKLLPSKKGTGKTAIELTQDLNAAGFEISLRQVQRDLNTLMEVFPLDMNDKDTKYGWKWVEGASVGLPGMSLSEALSLCMVEDTLKMLMPFQMLEGLESRFRQAENQLVKLANENRNTKWVNKVRSVSPTMPFIAPVIKSEILSAVHEALLSDTQIDVDYLKMGADTPTSKRISPIALVTRGVITYLIATMDESDKPFLYAMHRIRNAVKTNFIVKRPANFDLDNYIKTGELHFGTAKPISLSAWVLTKGLARVLEETPLSVDQQLEEVGDKFKLAATVADTDQLKWWLLSQSSNIEVTGPAALRKKIGGLLAEAAGLYSNQATVNQSKI